MRALVYGAMNPDLVHVVDRLPQAGDDIRSQDSQLTWGGKAANAAMALASWGVETRLLGLVIGEDPLGDVLVDALHHRNLDMSWTERSPRDRTRHCVILMTPDGDRTIVCGGYDDARWQDVPEAAWDGVDVALVDGFGGDAATAVVAGAHDRGIPVVWLDAPSPPPLEVDLVVWSRHERAEGEAAWLGVRGDNLALTSGAGPVLVFWAGERLEVSPPPVVITDSTGAGDVFAAACAFGIASGWAPRRLLGWAAAAGAASAKGGRAALPGRRVIDALAEGAVSP
jgi:sugar/nucleoside kinase (ribokinase family)